MFERAKAGRSFEHCPNRRISSVKSQTSEGKAYTAQRLHCLKYPEGAPVDILPGDLSDSYFTRILAQQLGCLACPDKNTPGSLESSFTTTPDGLIQEVALVVRQRPQDV